MEPMERDNRANRYTPETRERAVRMVLENESNYRDRSAAIRAIARKIGCSRESLRRWVAQSEIDRGRRDGVCSDERGRIRELEREVRELRQANEILKKASAYFAQAELDRPLKR
jgi:transposase